MAGYQLLAISCWLLAPGIMKRNLHALFCCCLFLMAAASICLAQPDTARKPNVYFGTLKDLDLANRVLYMDVININQRQKGKGVIAFQVRPDVLVNIEKPDRTFQKGKTLFDLELKQWIWIQSFNGRDFDSMNATSYQSIRGEVQKTAEGVLVIQPLQTRIGARRGGYPAGTKPRMFEIAAKVPAEYEGLPVKMSQIKPGMEVEVLTAFGVDVVKIIVTKGDESLKPKPATPDYLPPATPPVTAQPDTPPVTLPPVAPPTVVAPKATGKIVFHSNRDGNDEIYSMRADGTEQERLTNNKANDGGAVISPDGRLIAFTSNRDGNLEVYAMNADGSNQYRVTSHPANDIVSSWSPGGEYLAFYSNRNSNYDIFVTDVTGGMLNSLTESSYADDIEPSFSPDGERIAFCSKRDGNYEIYVMDTKGRNATRLTKSTLPDREPTWSPDGKKIAWTRRAGEHNENIYIMNADGSDQRSVTDYNGKDVRPSFSSDGKKIVFASDRNGNMEIYAMDLNGANVKALTDNLAGDSDPYTAGVLVGGR